MTTDRFSIPRRSFLAGSLAMGFAGSPGIGQEVSGVPDPNCPRCGGIGRVPVGDARPSVWMKGSALPKWDAATVGEQYCPVCQSGRKASELVAEAKAAVEAVLEKNKQWEDRTDWKLACV